MTRRLCAFALLSAFAVPAALYALSPFDPTYTVLHQSKRMLRGSAFADSWKPMRAALQAFRASPDESLYEKVFFEAGTKFQYAPTSLLVLEAAERMPLDDPLSDGTLNRFGLVAYVATLAIALSLFALALQRAGPPASGPAEQALRLVAALLLALTFYPALKAFTLGQLQTAVNVLAAYALLATALGARVAAGAAIGVACMLKPQLGLLLLWALLRRDWRFAGGLAGTAGVLGLISLERFGLANHLDYLRVLSVLSRHGESFYANQSINGLLHRALGNGNNLVWDASGFPPFQPAVYAVTIGTSLAFIGLALFWRRNEHRAAPALDLAVALLVCTMASPIAWEHHYGVLLPIFAFAAPFVWRAGRPGAGDRLGRFAAGAGLALIWLATSQFAQLTDATADSIWNVVQSTRFFGALALLALLLRLRGIETHRIESGVSAAASIGAPGASARP